MRVEMPKNVPGWERLYASCRRTGIKFSLVAPVEPGDPCWRVAGAVDQPEVK